MPSTELPDVVRSLHELPFEYLDGEGMDFEPYGKFLTSEEADSWLRAWTGNDSANAESYKVFGQDGTGGKAAIWLINEGQSLLEQPVVFFGSEGELGVIACCFADYLWLLAHGIGPYEATAYGPTSGRPNQAFRDFALKHAPSHERPAQEIVKSAKQEFPEFEGIVRGLCQ